MRFTITHHTEQGWNEVRLTDTQRGTIASVIPSAGSLLNGFSVERTGSRTNIIDGFRDADDWRARIEKGFQSAKLSPFVCRLRDSIYQWQGETYCVEKFSLNGSAIHGILYDASFETIEEKIQADHAEIELKYTYTGDVIGYPFPYDCYIRYRLLSDDSLVVTTAIHNRSETPIPVADGWHPYFTLGGPVDELTLQFHAKGQMEYDAGLLPTGRIIDNNEWSSPRRIGDKQIDDGFLLDFGYAQPLCTLENPETGMSVSFHPEPSYPYLQIYIPPHRRSIAIENLSAAPDAFNNGMGLISLEPDHTRTFSVRYAISCD